MAQEEIKPDTGKSLLRNHEAVMEALSALSNRTFCDYGRCSNPVLSSTAGISQAWPLSTWDVAKHDRETEFQI